ncbi:hypothetical protein GE300_01935 [Rhodobacteraceae bacterium 2CG4]|uniref:Uncharacterized protein n=1 Tax=Halovulum marinum TaxID=2662447 RepID=A0A6L5YWZ0_9RHOB|nr:hypothetical protein [Halovulum marinum]MSU88375.1 hypothetical protein [Halovulum marinum]
MEFRLRVSCLHTSLASIAAYEAAAPKGMRLTHHLRTDLEHRARTAGIDDGLAEELRMHLQRIGAGNDAVLLTSLHLARAAGPGLAADVLLAEELAARAQGKHVDVLHSDPADTFAVGRLFGATVGAASVRLIAVPDAHQRLLAGDRIGHDRAIRDAIGNSTADLVVLANPQMAQVASPGSRVFSAPRVALRRIAERAPHLRGG